MTATCRALGMKRVFGSYDGGGDESFTHLHGVEMSDGRVIEPDVLRKEAQGVDYDELGSVEIHREFMRAAQA